MRTVAACADVACIHTRVRILIAGLGAIGQRHARNLRTLLGNQVELFAFRRRRLRHVITDTLQRDDAADVETALGITAFDDLDTALAQRPDAVFICTPTSQHLPIAQRAAEAGCHLFIEKPLSHTLDGVDHLRQTVADRQRMLLVGCQWRFHPCIRRLRDLLAAGALGRIVRAEITYGEYLPDWHPYEDYRTSYAARADLGGGVVLTQIHDYDLARWLFGAPHTVTARGGHLSDLDIDVEDTVDAMLDGGIAPVHIRQTFASRAPMRVITVTGERGVVTADLFAGSLTVEPPLAPPLILADYQRNRMFLDTVTHFLARMQASGASPMAFPEGYDTAVSLDDGIATLRLALAVKDAMRTGLPVTVS